MKKIKRRIQKEHVVLSSFNAVEYFNKNKWKILFPAVLIIAISISSVIYYNINSGRQIEASYLLLKAKETKDFRHIIENFPRTKSHSISIIKLAKKMYLEQKYDEAKTAYSDFIGMYPTHKLVPAAYLGLAYCYEEEGNLEKTKELLNNIKEQYPNSLWAEDTDAGLERIAVKKST